MAAVKADPERPMDDAGDPAGGPQLRLKAIGDRAAHQLPDDLTTLAVGKRRRSTRCHAHLQALFPVSRQRIAPAHDGARCAPGHPPDLTERITLIKQSQRLTPPRLNHFRRPSGSCHGRVPTEVTRSLLHYLRDGQYYGFRYYSAAFSPRVTERPTSSGTDRWIVKGIQFLRGTVPRPRCGRSSRIKTNQAVA